MTDDRSRDVMCAYCRRKRELGEKRSEARIPFAAAVVSGAGNGDKYENAEKAIEVVARNELNGLISVSVLFEEYGDNIRIREGTLKAAAGNEQSGRAVHSSSLAVVRPKNLL
ncbi:hypothetical protein FVEG_06978 [Fusarium verticillioides 7600]|uniref:Uncharacterized protein n=1 Tax=Gibberella moniliformis (strain M3125 / FGSC 7600) TaxID=334819 RepID=W7MPG7_GIBM7|nr:hypothetical protein FVEG_06978 [Fusarium verticillioides 7600]EWG46512.1 hypothetical protein FVEG_06978 [Fusarium verticillioides 7600]